jgi:RND superfamily putative drug exporter
MRSRSSVLRWLLPAIIALLWLGLAGPLGSFSGKLGEVQENDSTAFLPDSAESTRVTELQRGFATERTLPVILLWESDEPLPPAAVQEAQGLVDDAVAVAEAAGALQGEASPVIPSEDGRALQAVLPFDPDLGDALPDVIGDLRELKKDGDVGEDEEHRAETDLQKLTDKAVGDIEALMKGKEEEILTV